MRRQIVGALLLLFAGALISEPAQAATSSVVISEVSFNDTSTTGSIELFNFSTETINLDGWVVEYVTPAAFTTDRPFNCSAAQWSAQIVDNSEAVEEIALSGQLLAGQAATVVFDQPFTALGSLRLVSAFDQQGVAVAHDMVGWTEVDNKKVCSEGLPAAFKAKSFQLSRASDEQGWPIDTNDNLNDFAETALSVPVIPCPIDLRLNELYPSPITSLGEEEYVELYNPTQEAMNLENCMLRRGDKLDINDQASWHRLSGILNGDAYLTVRVPFTLLNNGQLKDSSVVELFDANDISNRIDASSPYGAIVNGKSWSYVGESWSVTAATKASENPQPLIEQEIPKQEENDPEVLDSPVVAKLPPCAEGKYRNPLTNRCRNIETAQATLKPCDEDEERNSLTNRCRALAVLNATTLAACQPGQERNPATNRCRKIASAESSLKPCDPGQERNPQTNRCRKVAAVASATQSLPAGAGEQAITSPASLPVSSSWWIAGLVVSLAAAYAAYEWRFEIQTQLRRLIAKLSLK